MDVVLKRSRFLSPTSGYEIERVNETLVFPIYLWVGLLTWLESLCERLILSKIHPKDLALVDGIFAVRCFYQPFLEPKFRTVSSSKNSGANSLATA